MDISCETIFLKELQKNKATILTKENTRSARDKKREAWTAIQQVLVSSSDREYSVQQLCKKWNNLQQRVKEKIRNNGPDKVSKTLHERDMLCLQIIGPENLPAGHQDLALCHQDLGEMKSEEHDEFLPVVTMANTKNNNNCSPEPSSDSQVLDLVMSNTELKNDLVTSLASLQNSLSNGDTLESTSSGMLSSSPGYHSSNSDITLQDIDNIQTNIFTELANRISQINGTQPHDLSTQLVTSAGKMINNLTNGSLMPVPSSNAAVKMPDDLTNGPLMSTALTCTSEVRTCEERNHDSSNPTSMECVNTHTNPEEMTQNRNSIHRFDDTECSNEPDICENSIHNPLTNSSSKCNHASSNKRKRLCSASSNLAINESDRNIDVLKREILELKKEKLKLKNEKTRLQIERMRNEMHTKCSQTGKVRHHQDIGTQTLEPSDGHENGELDE